MEVEQLFRRRQNSREYIRQIDYVFYHEQEIREAVEAARLDSETHEIRNGSGLPDPTANEVIKKLMPVASVLVGGKEVLVAKEVGTPPVRSERLEVVGAVELKHPERWLEVVDKTYKWCKRQKGCHYEVARRRYAGEFYRVIHRELFISERRFFEILDDIKIYAALQAAQLGLIHVE